MQREHLEVVAQLLLLAGDGQDEDVWGPRFKEHLGRAMKKHGERLRGAESGTPLQGCKRAAEVVRARLELHEVVSERLEARVARLDADLAEAMAALRATSEPLVQQALAMVADGAADDAASESTFRACGKANDGSTGGAATEAARAAAQKVVAPRPRPMPCGQLLRLIEEVYASKASEVAGERVHGEGRGRPGTLEWHFYACLGPEGGCDGGGGGAVHERALSVFAAVQSYAPSRCQVEVFGKILQHRLPEGFAATLEEQKLTIRRLLRSYLDEAYQHRPPRKREAMWRIWAKSGVPFAACARATQHLYCGSDARALLSLVRRLVVVGGGAGAEAEEVKLQDFEQAVLRFQLQLTESFLEDLVEAFAKVDSVGDGVLDARGLNQLVDRMGVEHSEDLQEDDFAEDDAALRARLNERTCATFSECVELFAEVLLRRWETRGAH